MTLYIVTIEEHKTTAILVQGSKDCRQDEGDIAGRALRMQAKGEGELIDYERRWKVQAIPMGKED